MLELDAFSEVGQFLGGSYFDVLALQPEVRNALVDQVYALKQVEQRAGEIRKKLALDGV